MTLKRVPTSDRIYTPPPFPTLVPGSTDAEIYLDLLAAAVQGYASSQWSRSTGELKMASSSVASQSAVELADYTFAEYKLRTQGEKK